MHTKKYKKGDGMYDYEKLLKNEIWENIKNDEIPNTDYYKNKQLYNKLTSIKEKCKDEAEFKEKYNMFFYNGSIRKYEREINICYIYLNENEEKILSQVQGRTIRAKLLYLMETITKINNDVRFYYNKRDICKPFRLTESEKRIFDEKAMNYKNINQYLVVLLYNYIEQQ